MIGTIADIICWNLNYIGPVIGGVLKLHYCALSTAFSIWRLCFELECEEPDISTVNNTEWQKAITFA